MKKYLPIFTPWIALIIIVIFLCILGFELNLNKSEWASWAQSVGSIGAIFIAIFVVQFQHTKDKELKQYSENKTVRQQLIVLNWVFIAIASTCDKCIHKVFSENIRWDIEAGLIDDIRKVLISIPISEVPDPQLILRVIEISQSLQKVSIIIASLSSPRSKEIREKVISIIENVQKEALLGVTESSVLRVKYSSKQDIKDEFQLLDQLDSNRALMNATLEELAFSSTKQTDKAKD